MGGKHALVIPISAQAHYAGIFRLTVQLAKRGVSITLVSSPEELERLKEFDEVHDLHFNLVPYTASEEVYSKDILSFFDYARDLFQPIFDKLLEDQKAGRPGPTCIIGDRTLTWAKDIAKELNIPYYQFFSCGANHARQMQAMSDMFDDGILTKTDEAGGKAVLKEFEGAKEIPGIPSLRWLEMPSLAPLGADFFTAIGHTTGEADGVIVNTFYELEAPAIDAIQQRWREDPRGKYPELFLVGPLSNAASFKNRVFVAELKHTRGSDCLQWLDEQPPRSVIYFSLGSLVALDPVRMKELAGAIEASEQRFLWVINRGCEESLPSDFAARTRERGLVVGGWVPQLQILAHPATGGFVSHCGWNSVIESVSSGVPIAAWPQLRIDQHLNCRLVVDVLKVGVEVNPDWIGEETIASTLESWRKVIPEKIAKAMRRLLSEEGKAMRSRAEILKEKAQAAVADGGVSQKAINRLVECIPS